MGKRLCDGDFSFLLMPLVSFVKGGGGVKAKIRFSFEKLYLRNERYGRG